MKDVWIITGEWDNRILEVCDDEELAECLALEIGESCGDVEVERWEVRSD